MEKWQLGWSRVLGTLGGLTPADLGGCTSARRGTSRPQAALSHTAQHVGQIMYLAKHLRAGVDDAQRPRAQSAQYNRMVQEQARAEGAKR
jgi:hypothetical protein